ncbi:hypothetical protein Tco_1479888, partial [Tanacetum coccineum]
KATCKGQGRTATTGGNNAEASGVDVGSQGSSHTGWTKRRVQTVRISLQKTTPTQPISQPSTSSQVPVTEIRNADRRNVIVAGADNRPPMLDKTQYSSWASRMLLYIRGKENGKLLFDSVLNGPFKYCTVTVLGT